MKRIILSTLILSLFIPACAFAAHSAVDGAVKNAAEGKTPGDISAVIEADERAVGPVYGINEETGARGEVLYVDAPLPADFTDDQRAVITAEHISIDRSSLLEALRARGVSPGSVVIKPGVAYNDDVGRSLSSHEALSSEAAAAIARQFVADCGLGDTYLLFALRPEEEARGLSAQEAPEAQEDAYKRILREWHRANINYTSVRLGFTLRGLPVESSWTGADGVARSSVANLYVGDAGEIRDFSLWYAPREVRAQPYTGALKTWREALCELSSRFGAYNGEPRTDIRGRQAPPLRTTITDILPGYASSDGVTFFPAWIFIADTFALCGDDSVPVNSIWTYAIDARIGY